MNDQAPCEKPELNLQTIEILGTKVHKATMADALRALETLAAAAGTHMVITLNTEMVMRAQKDREFRTIINNASLVLADTVGLLWASRILGSSLPERMAGVDTVEHFMGIAAQTGLRVFLLGAAPGVADRAAEIFQQHHPGLIVAGTYSGSPSPSEDKTICSIVNQAAPDVLLVAYKVPEQEFWIARNLCWLHAHVVINVGGTFDFVAGVTIRAPRWIRTIGLEWLHRLIQQPQRWRRMLALPRFVLRVFLQRLQQFSSTRWIR